MKKFSTQHIIREKIQVSFPMFLLGILCIGVISCNQNQQNGYDKKSNQYLTALQKEIPIWTKFMPDSGIIKGIETTAKISKPLVGGRYWTGITNVSNPRITIYPPKAKNTGVAVVVFPGGGYRGLAIDIEGSEICEWLASIGITGILLKYRVPKSGPYWDSTCNCQKDPVKPLALQDAQRTLGLVRFHAKEWNIDPNKVGVIGFSAGGHLVANISTHYKERIYPITDSADKESCKPNFAIALYPGHMREHTTKEYDLNPTIPIDSNTPPTFLLQAGNDPVDDIEESLVYYMALNKAGVPTEYHIYADGKHAFGVRKTNLPINNWIQLVETWLHTIHMIAK